jgi:hypothetical protein
MSHARFRYFKRKTKEGEGRFYTNELTSSIYKHNEASEYQYSYCQRQRTGKRELTRMNKHAVCNMTHVFLRQVRDIGQPLQEHRTSELRSKTELLPPVLEHRLDLQDLFCHPSWSPAL